MFHRTKNPRSMTAQERNDYRSSLAGSRFRGTAPETLADGSAIYTTDDGSRFYLLAFTGCALRSDGRVSGWYRSDEQRASAIERYKQGRASFHAAALTRRAAARAPHTLKVGDVLNTCWGYDQTNVEFFEVVAVRGSLVDLRELAKEREEYSTGMQGRCRPIPGRYIDGTIKGKRPNSQNRIRFESFRSARPYGGGWLDWSSYA